jgi:predicted acetyltransferase
MTDTATTDTINGLEVSQLQSEDEFAAYARTFEAAFGGEPQDGDLEAWRRVTEPDRTWTVREAGRIVATSGIVSLSLSVPGARVPMAGVTAVGVLPTHRRRGLLRGMMRRMLEQARERDEPLAGLWASESVIYGRYGFGTASFGEHFELDARRSRFRHDVEPPAGLRLLDPDEALKQLPPLYERVMDAVPGAFSRSPARWKSWLGHDPDHSRDGAGPRFVAVWDGRGYVIYRIRQDWKGGIPNATLHVEELAAVDDEAHAALWRWLLDMELVGTLTALHRPVDDPLPHLLADPRLLKVGRTDALWLRPVDVATVLAGRQYSADGRLVLDLRDEFCAWNTGRWLLDVADGTATCRPTSDEADLTLGPEELAMAYLGATPLRRLARVRRVDEHRAGALARADRMFVWASAPWCPQEF